MQPLPATLDTPRLHLRPPEVEDAVAIFERYASDPEVTQFMSWKRHQCPSNTRDFLHLLQQWQVDGHEYDWAICCRASERLIGMIGARPRLPRVEIGYVLARDMWGQGLMTEAARVVVETLLADPDVWRVDAHCATDNVASARVLEKVGFEYEGTLRRYMVLPNRSDIPVDVKIFARVHEA